MVCELSRGYVPGRNQPSRSCSCRGHLGAYKPAPSTPHHDIRDTSLRHFSREGFKSTLCTFVCRVTMLVGHAAGGSTWRARPPRDEFFEVPAWAGRAAVRGAMGQKHITCKEDLLPFHRLIILMLAVPGGPRERSDGAPRRSGPRWQAPPRSLTFAKSAGRVVETERRPDSERWPQRRTRATTSSKPRRA